MSKYIDAENIGLTDFEIFTCNGDYKEALKLLIMKIENAPIADVMPIEWIKEQKDKCFPYSTTALALNGLITEWERRENVRESN